MKEAFPALSLHRAVSALCPDIHKRVLQFGGQAVVERQLWWELSCCVLSSQVPFTLAAAAASRIDRAGLLHGSTVSDMPTIRADMEALLVEPLEFAGARRRYRFPVIRADQLARGWGVIRREYGSLASVLAGDANAAASRTWLVANVPGLGPKQASMFLRNAGASYELAVLDRHVLNYMSALGLCDPGAKAMTSLSAYERNEASLRRYAEEIGYSVGLVDWAIWIVMRAAGELSREGARQ